MATRGAKCLSNIPGLKRGPLSDGEKGSGRCFRFFRLKGTSVVNRGLVSFATEKTRMEKIHGTVRRIRSEVWSAQRTSSNWAATARCWEGRSASVIHQVGFQCSSQKR